MNTSLSFAGLMTALMLATTSLVTTALTSCKEKPRTIGEKIDDALDARPNEKIKDAVEDIKDAAKDVKEAVKDAGKELKQ